MKLNLIKKISGFKVLTCHNNYFYLSRGYSLFKIDGTKLLNREDANLERVGFYRQNLIRKLLSGNRFTSRLLRTGFHSIDFFENKIIAVLDKNICVLEPESKEFRTTFKIKRGTRPLGISITQSGKIYWGEYFRNINRNSVNIYNSSDGGYNWEIVYTFPENTIKHIHNVQYDPFYNCIWILTGDLGKEAKIIKADIDFSNIEAVFSGTQEDRAGKMIFTEESILYGTDTQLEQNYIYKISRSTLKRKKLCKIESPCLWATKIKDICFFSTHVEPGNSFYPAACLYAIKEEKSYFKLLEWEDDWLPSIFGFSTIILPSKSCDFKILFATGYGLKNRDRVTYIWKVMDDE